MIGAAVVLVLLAVPAWHQATAHRVFQPGHTPTAHELRHAQRTMWRKLALDAAWLAYLAGTLGLGLLLR